MNAVVVGVEDTNEARDALQFARFFANAEDADLHVVAVYSDSIFYEGLAEMEAARQNYFDRMRKITEDQIGEDLNFIESVEISPPRGLTQAAEEVEAGALVIGSSHRGPIGRVLMGDEGARLAAGAPCSLIVTPRGWHKRAHDQIAKIGIAFDGSDEAEAGLKYGGELAAKLGAAVEVIGVVPAAVTPGRGGFSDKAFWDLLKSDLENDVAEAAERIGVDRASGHVRAGYAADELAEASINLDLLVLGSRSYGPIKRVFMGGTSVRVMRSAACPVVIVPRAGD